MIEAFIVGLTTLGYMALVLSPLFVLAVILSSDIPYVPMTYDEEMYWLTKDCGLSEEEAQEIAELPSRG